MNYPAEGFPKGILILRINSIESLYLRLRQSPFGWTIIFLVLFLISSFRYNSPCRANVPFPIHLFKSTISGRGGKYSPLYDRSHSLRDHLNTWRAIVWWAVLYLFHRAPSFCSATKLGNLPNEALPSPIPWEDFAPMLVEWVGRLELLGTTLNGSLDRVYL